MDYEIAALTNEIDADQESRETSPKTKKDKLKSRGSNSSEIVAGYQDVSVGKSSGSWGSLNDGYDMPQQQSKGDTRIEDEIDEEIRKFDSGQIDDDDDYSDDDFNFGMSEVSEAEKARKEAL